MKPHDDASAVDDEVIKNADSDEEDTAGAIVTFQEIRRGRKRTTKSQVRHFRLVRNMDEVMESGFVYRKMLAVDIPMFKSGAGLNLLRYLGLADFLLTDIPHLDKPSCDEFIRTYDGVSKVGKVRGVNVVLDAASVAASLKLPLGRQDLQETLITSIHRKDQHDRLNEILNNSSEKRIRGYDLGQLLYVDQPVEIVSVIVSALMSKMECTKECFHYTTPEVLLAVDSAIQGVKVQWAGRFAENISRAVVKSQNWKNGTPTAFAFGEWLSKIISYQVNMQKARKKRKLGDTMEEVQQDAASFQELKELKASLKARDEEVKKLTAENERLGLEVSTSLKTRDEEVKKLMAENERLGLEVSSLTSARRKRKFGDTMEESMELKALVEARDQEVKNLTMENEQLMLEVKRVEEAKVRLANAAAESDARASQVMNEKELLQRNLAEIKAECERLKKDFNDVAKVKAEQHRKDCNDFNDVAKLKAENEQLKKDVNNFNVVAVKSGQQVAELNEQLKKAAKALNNIAANNGQQIADLKRRSEQMKRDMRKQIANVQMENQQLKLDLQDNRVVELKAELEQVKQDLAYSRERVVVGLRSDLANCEKRARLELANSENLRIENGQLLKRLSDFKREFDHAFDGLMTENEQLRQNISWYASGYQAAAVQTENERLMLDLERLTVENQQVKAEIGILEEKNCRLQNSEEVSRLRVVSTKQVEQLKAQKEQEQKLRAELSAALEKLASLSQVNVELGKLKEEHEKLIYRNGDLSFCLNSQRQAVTRLENQNQGLVSSLAAEKSQLEKERLDLQEKLSQMRDNWEKSTQELKEKEEQLDQAKVNDLSQEVAKLQEQLEEKVFKEKKMMEEKWKLILGFRVKETELSQEVAKLQNEVEILKQEKERVESSLRNVHAGQQKVVLHFKRQIDTVKASNEELQTSKWRAEENLQQLEATRRDMEIGIRKAEEALSEKSRQIEQMKRELSRVQAELELLKKDDVKRTERWAKLKEDCEAEVIRLNKEKNTEKRLRTKQVNQLRSKENENLRVIDELKAEVISLQENSSILKQEREGLKQELAKLMKSHEALKIHENEQLLAQKKKFNEILSKMAVMASEAISHSSMENTTTSGSLE